MWRYKGGGYFPGIPARDIPDDEAKALSEDGPVPGYDMTVAELLKASPMYAHEADKPAPAPAAAAEKEG